MTTEEGLVLNKWEIVSTHGGVMKFRNALDNGTAIWIHYGPNGQPIAIEQRIAPRYYLPNIRDKDGAGK